MTLVRLNTPKQNGRRFNIFMDDFFSAVPSLFREEFSSGLPSSVPVNIKETESEYLLEVMAPGLEKEGFKISLEENLLTISAEKKEESANEEEKQIRREFSTSSFRRSFTINEQVDAQQIVAKYINGVLTVNLPKKAEVKPPVKEINIQ